MGHFRGKNMKILQNLLFLMMLTGSSLYSHPFVNPFSFFTSPKFGWFNFSFFKKCDDNFKHERSALPKRAGFFSWFKSFFSQQKAQKFSESEDPTAQLYGFKNRGNDCGINSILQLILRSDTISQLVTTNIIKNRQTKTQAHKKAENELNALQKSLLTDSNPDTTNFSLALRQLSNLSQDGQEDATEFMRATLEVIGDSENSNVNNNDHAGSSLFTGKYISKLTCGNCSDTKSNTETETILTVPITPENNLVDSLKSYFANESVRVRCGNCGITNNHNKCIIANILPRNLFISLKRFEFNPITMSAKKISTPVQIPEQLQLADQYGKHAYELKGSVVHSGTINGGHYTAYALTNGKWYYFNDAHNEQVSKESMQAFIKQGFDPIRSHFAPYILGYRKIEADTKVTAPGSPPNISELN